MTPDHYLSLFEARRWAWHGDKSRLGLAFTLLLDFLPSTGYGVVMIKWWATLVAICLCSCPFWSSHRRTWEGSGELEWSVVSVMEIVYVQLLLFKGVGL